MLVATKRFGRGVDPGVRFWSRVAQEGDCWIWWAALDNGYGVFTVQGKNLRAHRWAYEQMVADIPEGLVLDHLCRNRACVNPDHLEPVTHRVNLLRGKTRAAKNAAKTHCLRGHEFTAANTGTYEGRRICRRCKADLAASLRAKGGAQRAGQH